MSNSLAVKQNPTVNYTIIMYDSDCVQEHVHV